MLRDIVETSRFHVNKQTYKLLEEIETIVTTVFEKGSRAKAMKRLRVPHRDDKLGAWTAFKLGIMMGTAIVLFAVLAVSGQINPNEAKWRVIVRFFRGPAVLNLDNLAHHHLWNISAVLGVTWAISLVLFLHSSNVGIPAYVSPFALLCVQLVFLCNPLPCLYWSSRKWLWKILLRIFTAPFHRVSFADFWMADQLSSLAALTLDYQFMFCFFLTDLPAPYEVEQ
ncbi:unnamed protein product [Allacma fusca]|uniref:EXS domain-containing protein n=1 Tax=Allacma fusca TaxID=39272 RepID=A0A8J2Q4S2_9HEXA|nr:unnamed protein product [Allacma fusca]